MTLANSVLNFYLQCKLCLFVELYTSLFTQHKKRKNTGAGGRREDHVSEIYNHNPELIEPDFLDNCR